MLRLTSFSPQSKGPRYLSRPQPRFGAAYAARQLLRATGRLVVDVIRLGLALLVLYILAHLLGVLH